LALAEALRTRFGLREAMVAPDAGGTDAGVARRAVGMVAAGWFCRIAATGPMTVGVGWGRTLSAMADVLTNLHNPDLRVVSLMGAMVRTGPEGPIDVCARIAAVAGGQALFLPAPFLADSVEDAAIIARQRLVREALEAARGASHMVVSVGEGGRDALLTTSGVLDASDLAALDAAGVIADTTGKFLRADGTLASVELNDRTPAIGLDDMKRAEVTLLAAGTAKAAATRAVLRAGFVDRIVIDEAQALILMEGEE
jgi:DNA-binding transcriptional regulator LsrR (DeoR family)